MKNTDDKKQNTHFKARRTIFLVLAILFIGVFLGNFVSSFDWHTGLKAYYDLEDNQDSSVNAKHLTSGTGIYTAGLIGNCLNNSYIYGQFADFGINASSDKSFSISLWVNKYSTGSQHIVAFDDTLANPNYGETAQYALSHANGGTRWQSAVNDWKNVTNILDNPPIGWRHLVAVKNSTNLMFYVNGTLKQKIKIGSWNSKLTKEFLIGADNIMGNVVWKGKIDEVGVWQRELTPADITYLYNGGVGVGLGISNVPTITLINPSNGSSLSTIGTNFTANFNTTLLNYVWKNATFYVYNTTVLFNKTTISLSGNHTQGEQFIDSFVLGDYHWNVLGCYGNITFSNCTFATSNFTYFVGINIISVNYETSVFESTYQNISINLSYAPELLTSSGISIILNYNGTNYTTSYSGTTTNLNFKAIVIPPSVSSPTNISFHFITLLTVGSQTYQFLSETYNQTVNNLQEIIATQGNCAAGLTRTFHFSFRDETTRITIPKANVTYVLSYGLSGNPNAKVINGSFSNIGNLSICINNSNPYYTVGYGEVDYKVTGYVDRRFYIFSNTRLTNSTVSNVLYSLDSTLATSFLLTVQDNGLNPYGGYYVTLLRWYPEINEYKVVSMAKTDDKGQGILRVKTEDVTYRLGVYSSNGVLQKLINPLTMVCLISPCAYNIYIQDVTNDYSSYLNVQSSFTFNNATKIFTFTWSDPSQSTSAMTLLVTKSGGETVLCNISSESFTGVLTCDVSGQTGLITAKAYRSASPLKFFSSKIVDLSTGLKDIAGGRAASLIISFILVALLALIGIFSPFASILLGVIGLIPATIWGGFPYIALIGIGILGGIVIHFIRRT